MIQLIHLSGDLSSHFIPLLSSRASFACLLECQHLEYTTVFCDVFAQSVEQQVPGLSVSKSTVGPNHCKSNTTFLLSCSRFLTFLTTLSYVSDHCTQYTFLACIEMAQVICTGLASMSYLKHYQAAEMQLHSREPSLRKCVCDFSSCSLHLYSMPV